MRKNNKRNYPRVKICFSIIALVIIFLSITKCDTIKNVKISANVKETTTEKRNEKTEIQDNEVVETINLYDVKESYKKDKLLIEHTTSNWGSSGNRNINLKVAAEIISSTKNKKVTGKGYLLQPGETFSFLETIGEPTYEKGFKDAPCIIGHQLVNDVAGGYCQNAISLYSAARDLGLEVTGNPHSEPSHYVVKGYDYDVTVTYTGGKDITVTNNKEYPVILKQIANGCSVKTEIYKAVKVLQFVG